VKINEVYINFGKNRFSWDGVGEIVLVNKNFKKKKLKSKIQILIGIDLIIK